MLRKRNTDANRVQGQIDRGEVDASPAAARKIAKRIENGGGFWTAKAKCTGCKDGCSNCSRP